MTLLVVAACFAASVIGGLIVARITRRPLAEVRGAERAEAWSRIAGYAALHYGGTTERPGPEADFPREAVRWMVLADGTLYAPNVRMEGGTLRPCPDLSVGLWTDPVGGSLSMLFKPSWFDRSLLEGGASSVWLSDLRLDPPPVRA